MSRASERGYAYQKARARFLADNPICWICGHAGVGEIDHYPERTVLRLDLDPSTWRPSHGHSRPCPTCGISCNQERGSSALGVITTRRVANSEDW